MATPYRISIGVNIDASGAKSGSADAKQAVSSIGIEAEKAAPKVEKVAKAARELETVGGNKAAAASIDAIRTAASAAVPSMDRLVNSFAGINTGANDNGRAADIAAYAAEMDRLRAKFDPIFAAQQRYKQKIEEINQAERVGAITASMAIEARLREANAYDGLISKVERLGAARKAAAQEIVDRQTITPDRGADIESYGRSLDQLRAKYSPLYAAITQYKQAQLEIRNAHSVGAISADEMSAALSRQRQATLQSIDAIKGRNRAIADTAPHRGFETANIAAQFQDIGVTAAMGMSPLQIALQQGTQLSAVLSTMDKPVMGLAAAFASVLSPLSLVTIGVVAAGAAAIQYFASVGAGTKTVDEILARHQESIDALGPAYQRALAEQRKYAAASVDILNARLGDNAKDAQTKLQEEARAAYSSISSAMQGSIWGSRGDDSMFRFNGAREALAAFLASIEEGTPKVSAFEAEVSRLEQAKAISPDAAKELRNFIKDAADAEEQLSTITGKVDPVAHAFAQLQARIEEVNPFNATGRVGELSGKLDELWRNMRSGRVDTIDLGRELDRLRTINPDMSDAIDEIERLGRAALAAMQDVQSFGTVAGALGKSGRNPLEVRNNERGQDRDLFLRTDTDLRDKLKSQADEMERAANKASRAGASARNAYRDLIKSADDRIAQMKLEAEMAGKVGIEAEALRFQLDLLQRSEDKGRSITEAQRAAIEQRVQAFKAYAEAAATAKLSADLLWESEQAGRTWMDQQVAGRLRSAGLPIDFESYEAGLIRTNLALQSARDYAGDFAHTLFDGLDQGKGLFDSLADAGIAAFKRLGRSLLDDFLNNLFSIKGAAGGGGGGGLFGGGLFSSLIGNLFSPQWRLASGGAIGLFDSGGYTGPGGIHEPRGVVHAGEVVWSQRDVARAGGVNVVEAMRLGLSGYAGGGAVDVQPMLPASRSVDQVGQASTAAVMSLKILLGIASDGNLNLRPEVEALIDERTPGIAAEIVELNNGTLPDRVAEIQQNPRWR